MELKKLKELQNKIQSLASTLDAVTEDYFGTEEHLIRQELEDAWRLLDAALDNIYFEIKCRKEKDEPAGTDPGEPVPDIDRETFKELLQKVTPESLQKANKAAVFFREKSEDEEGIKLSKECQAAFIAVMLFEYGKLMAGKDERAQVTDQEGKEGKEGD